MGGEGVGGILGYKEIQHMALFLVEHSDEPLRDSSPKVDREDLLQGGVVCITPKG
jgi:hypothetical protein